MVAEAIKKSQHRSPNYPAMSLPDALDRARLLYEKDRRAGAPLDVTLKHLGYNSRNGAALRTVAALKKFGLTEERDGRIYVSQLALDALLYPDTDERRTRAIHESALKPVSYGKVYERYRGGLPSDETIKAELIREHGFNDNVVDSFLRDLKLTLDFAGLRFGEDMPEGKQVLDQPGQHVTRIVSGHVESRGQSYVHGVGEARRSFPIPLKKQNEVTLTFSRLPIDADDLYKLKSWIDLMGENLIEPIATDDHDNH